MPKDDKALLAHLMRRAGFGATPEELDEYATNGYEAVVDDLLHPERFPDIEEDVLLRYYGEYDGIETTTAHWIYRMLNTKKPLQEKMALFWHSVFCVGFNKSAHPPSMGKQIQMFRDNGLSDMRTLLTELSKDPAMVDYLDNNENHKVEPNENYGREIMELFSMGTGNYTEYDIKMAARSFTGWTFKQPTAMMPYGHSESEFVYVADDHDDSEKTFLGQKGRFNGEDIIDIIVEQKATAKFISRHLYDFFVEDEVQVPAWNVTPPKNPKAIESLMKAYTESDGEIRSMLKVLFNSDFFKEARFKRVKSPAELIAGTVKLAGSHRFPDHGLLGFVMASSTMGQEILNPPSVEGWHAGKEWINGGTLNQRVNFAVAQMSDINKPGVKSIIDRIGSEGKSLSPKQVMEKSLDLMGSIAADKETEDALLSYAESGGEFRFGTEKEREESASRIGRLLQLIVASPEYQFA